jgi:hypothetical protein
MPNTRVIMSRRIRLVGHVACMGEMGNVYGIMVGETSWKTDVDGKIILEWILGKYDGGGGAWTEFFWLGMGTSGGL